MAYDFYIGKMLFPVPPETINIQINGRNETVVLINDGEINMLKAAGLTSGSFTLLLPNTPYPFARYTDGFQNAKVYLDYLESLKKESKVVQCHHRVPYRSYRVHAHKIARCQSVSSAL